ncbi:hypothetical protein EVAR_51743_1 [Eumeta japonica]|uniref:Uncharacterized protein n=1 Tax=Eumeta variegata TaxID=151549 RepID=A0A4C1XHB9_EUMVA|nr:hypothetical protein EVAR_51743_1 [Eumeta japonica]
MTKPEGCLVDCGTLENRMFLRVAVLSRLLRREMAHCAGRRATPSAGPFSRPQLKAPPLAGLRQNARNYAGRLIVLIYRPEMYDSLMNLLKEVEVLPDPTPNLAVVSPGYELSQQRK